MRAGLHARDQTADGISCVSITTTGYAITGTTLVWENGVRRVMRVAVVVVMVLVLVVVVVGSD